MGRPAGARTASGGQHDHSGRGSHAVGVPDDDGLLGELAEALRRVRGGDLKVRLPRRPGWPARSPTRFNEVVALQERQNLDLRRISRSSAGTAG